MKCPTHPDRDATGFCRTCGKPLCPECTRDVRGILYCEPCLAAMVGAAPNPAVGQVVGPPNPGVAAALGIIPGLGAIYNGEYVKGLIHIAVFAGIIAILNNQPSDSLQVFFAIGLACFICYMPIEAYRTAKMKQAIFYGSYVAPQAGVAATAAAAAPAAQPEGAQAASFAGPSAAPFAGAPGAPAAIPQAHQGHFQGSMAGAIVLIALGVLILLGNLGLLSGEWFGRWWPALLVALGVWLIWKRSQKPAGGGNPQP